MTPELKKEQQPPISKAKHLMIDIETLGTTARSTVTQIGLCLFKQEEILLSDNLGLEPEGQPNRGVCNSTLAWWEKQQNNPWLEPEYQYDNISAMRMLKSYADQADFIWAWHPHFDIAILEDLIIGFGEEVPWSHRQIIDASSFKFLEASPARSKEVTHNGEEDAIQQAEWVIELFRNKSFTF